MIVRLFLYFRKIFGAESPHVGSYGNFPVARRV